MAEYTANAPQTVNPGESVIFTATLQPCPWGLVRHFDGEGDFLLAGNMRNRRGCCPCRRDTTEYTVDFGANVSIPEGGTPGPISLAIARDGTTLPYTTMTVTPAEAEELQNVSRATKVPIWNGCCQSVSVRNVGPDPIVVQNANIIFSKG